MKKRSIYTALLVLIASMALTGCSNGRASKGQFEYTIYCLDRDENTHRTYSWYTDINDRDELVKAMLAEMSSVSENVGLREAIRDYEVLSYEFDGGQLTLDVSGAYTQLSPTTEILVRGALVRTLTQAEGVDKVCIEVSGAKLLDALGQPVGVMSATQFVDNAGNEINSYEAIKIALYFANAEGDGLTRVNRTLEYNTNISTEKLIVEQLLAGPNTPATRACLNPQTQVINVTIKDGIGYVSLDSNFLIMPEGIAPDIAVYSIVNSLSELPGVNKVQISIDGDTNIILNDGLSLDTMFERNLDIVD